MLKIQMNGDVFACCQGQPVTNLSNTDPLDIWNSPRMLELREQLDSENYDALCRRCTLVQNCAEEQSVEDESLKRLRCYRLVGGAVIDENGHSVSSTTNVTGWIETVTKQGNMKVLQGWAVNTITSQPASAIMVAVNGLIVDAAVLSVERPDVAIALKNPGITKCGFSIKVPFFPDDAVVQVFATDNRGEISVLRSFKRKSAFWTRYFKKRKNRE